MVTRAAYAEIWDREYREIQSIPSSTRRIPSKALLLFDQFIDLQTSLRVLDAGCGNGRNAIYLAAKGCNVIAADFSLAALASTEFSIPFDVKNRVSVMNINLLDPLQFDDDRFDLCLDSYVSCHFVDEDEYVRYWSELVRVTRPGGKIFSSVFSHDDEYYNSNSDNNKPHESLVTDRHNGITKRLYDEMDYKSSLPTSLNVQFFLKFQFNDRVFGRNYKRSLFVTMLQKT